MIWTGRLQKVAHACNHHIHKTESHCLVRSPRSVCTFISVVV
jgi:hypothetical protein